MPKPKPDQVVRHEVVLGKSERDLLRGAAEAYQFNKISTPIVAGLSDVTFTATVAALLALILKQILDRVGLDPNWPTILEDMTPDQVKDWLETQNIVLGGLGFLVGGLLGGPWGAGIGAAAGSATAEGLEAIEEEAKKVDLIADLYNWWKSVAPEWAYDAPLWE